MPYNSLIWVVTSIKLWFPHFRMAHNILVRLELKQKHLLISPKNILYENNKELSVNSNITTLNNRPWLISWCDNNPIQTKNDQKPSSLGDTHYQHCQMPPISKLSIQPRTGKFSRHGLHTSFEHFISWRCIFMWNPWYMFR